LGSAVAEALGETHPVPMERIGIKESFGEVGSQDWLMDHFGLRAENIAQAAIRVIERKKNQ
ncbi:MAG TPA: transketolase family protein, partial [Clostridia bacterium]|nr:transketolase family protein [Clostridia bacterium]